MTNYIEELSFGDSFLLSEKVFVITSDSKKNGSRLCIDLKSGHTRWIDPDTIVTKISLMYTDKDGNFISIKELSKEDVDA